MRKRIAVLVAGVAFAISTPPLSAPALATRGDPDPSFGGDGSVLTDFGGEDSALAAEIDGQGRIVVAGTGGLSDPARPGATTFSVARYLDDGAPDPAFSGDGRVQSDFGDTRAEAQAVLIDPAGRILVAGTTTSFDGIGSAIALARFLPDGSPDPSFGAGGQVETRLGLSGAADAVLDGEGRIVVAGSAQRTGRLLPTIARYLPDGSLDPSFGDAGVREVRLGGFSAFRAVSVSHGGRIVAVGDTDSPGSRAGRFTAIGLRSDGGIDPEFGHRGRTRILRGVPASGADVLAISAGKTLLAGSCICRFESGRRRALVVAMLNRGGELRQRFGRHGIARIAAAGAAATALEDVVGHGYAIAGEGHDGWLLAEFTVEGRVDGGFASRGISATPGLGGVEALAAPDNGSLIAVGTGTGAADTDFEVRRFLPWSPP